MAGRAQAVFQFALKHGPKMGEALAVLVSFIKANPDLPAVLRERLVDISRRINALSKRGGAAKINGMLDIIRDFARDASPAGADSRVDAGLWMSRVDSIRHRVRLASALPRPAQKKNLALLMTETENALADLINTLAIEGSTVSPTQEP